MKIRTNSKNSKKYKGTGSGDESRPENSEGEKTSMRAKDQKVKKGPKASIKFPPIQEPSKSKNLSEDESFKIGGTQIFPRIHSKKQPSKKTIFN